MAAHDTPMYPRENSRPPGRRGALRRRDDAGQALAEFVIVVPLLVFLVFGIVEFGAAWRSYQVVTNTAREGARMAVVANGATYNEVREAIDERLRSGGLDPNDAAVEIRCDDGTEEDCFGGVSSGSPTEVHISYPYTFLFLGPVADFIAGDGESFGTVTMRTGITMRNE